MYNFNEVEIQPEHEELIDESENEEMSEEMRCDIFESVQEDLFDVFSSQLEAIGFMVDPDEFRYTGFNSQGDGLSFYGYIDIEKYITKTKQRTKYRTLLRNIENGKVEENISIEPTLSHYYHERTCYVDDLEVYDEVSEKCLDSIEVLKEELEEKRLDLCKEFYDILECHYNSI